MKRLISLCVVGIFLVATPAFGSIKMRKLGENRYWIERAPMAIRFLVQGRWEERNNKRVARLKRESASLCLGLEYSWMVSEHITYNSIIGSYFHSKAEAQEHIDGSYNNSHLQRGPGNKVPTDWEGKPLRNINLIRKPLDCNDLGDVTEGRKLIKRVLNR
jgi:hypothetical protein